MEKSISMITFILFLYLQSILGFERVFEISPIRPNITGYAWVNDNITIKAKDIGGEKWLFNTSVLFTNTGAWTAENSSIALQINATIISTGIASSELVLKRVHRFHSGNYAIDENPDIYSLNLTVYEAKLFSIEPVLRNDSNLCKAFLLLNDSIEPSDLGISRTANSSELTFISPTSSTSVSFEILNSSIDILNVSKNIDIDVEYKFDISNYSTVLSTAVFLGQLVKEPNVTTTGFLDNCTVHIHHRYMKNIECVRNITYRLKTNDTEFYSNTFDNLDPLGLDYTWNLTSIDLVIEYDIIYGKYIFNTQVKKCAEYVIFSTTFTTSISYTTENNTSENMTNYSGSTYFSTFATPITTTPKEPGSLVGWQIALIVIGSVLGALLLVGVIGFFIWKNQSRRTFDTLNDTRTLVFTCKIYSISSSSGSGNLGSNKIKPDEPEIPMDVRPTQPKQIVQKRIQESKSGDRRQSTSSSNSLTSESSERSQRDNYHRRQPIPPPRSINRSSRLSQQPQTSSHHEQFQPRRPLPTPKSSYDLDKQERRRVASPNYELDVYPSSSQAISRSPHPIDQHQVPRGRRRPLPPLPND